MLPCMTRIYVWSGGTAPLLFYFRSVRRWMISSISRSLYPISPPAEIKKKLKASWNMMAHAQKLDFVFRRKRPVHLNRRGRGQFSRLLAAEVCASAVIMLDTPCSEVVWRVLATHSIRQFPLHFPSRASPCAITFQLESTHRPSLKFDSTICRAPCPPSFT